MVECAFRIHDASSCFARISLNDPYAFCRGALGAELSIVLPSGRLCRADGVAAKISIIVCRTTRRTYNYSLVEVLDRYANGCKLVEMKTINAPVRAARRSGQAA